MPPSHHDLPIELLPHEPALPTPDEGLGLCLSGGGYRAMIFHAGALWRLYEAGLLRGAARISSVSGGSITAGVLALAWPRLSWKPAAVRDDFVPRVVDPLRRLARVTVDVRSVLVGLLPTQSSAHRVANAYDSHLFGGVTLQALPDTPSFIINATSMQSGVLWRFSKPYMADWRVGKILRPDVRLAVAVAASSAFPPYLSPLTLDVEPSDFTPHSGADLQREPYTKQAVLTDGGVYDNLGLETVFKRYHTVLASDGGGHMDARGKPSKSWSRQTLRVLEIMDRQVRSLRKRQLIGAFETGLRQGTYWSTWTDIRRYPVAGALDCPFDRTQDLARLPTRLARMDDPTQERLINWGYAICDAAIRAHLVPQLEPPKGFPYPGGV